MTATTQRTGWKRIVLRYETLLLAVLVVEWLLFYHFGTTTNRRGVVVGFGTFLPRKRKARSGRSPLNGKEIRIHSKTVPAFAAGQGFKDRVEGR